MTGAVGQDRTLSERYLLEREIGRGGMGVVYLARDLKYDKPVAIKFLEPETASTVSAERFVREIRTTARLRHQNILTIEDSDEADGQLYYVMLHVDGSSLRERLERGGRMPVVDSLRITRQVAAALAHAHSEGIVHRDIKPENILVNREDHVYVADFGLAHVLSLVESSRLTGAGITVGTPAYMSPEQAAGEEDLDGRSDVYALGCVLYEMLVGEPPFSGPGAQAVMRRQLTEPAPSVRRRRADVPASVDALLGRMLAKDPDDRLESAKAVCASIDVELGRVGNSGRGRTLTQRLPASTTRVKAIVLAVAVVLAGLLTLKAAPRAFAMFGNQAYETDVYLVLPLRVDENTTPPSHLDLHAAFARWDDLTLIDPLRTEEALGDRGGMRSLGLDDALALAGDLGAGRYVQGVYADLGDSVQIGLSLHSTADGRPLRSASMRAAAGANMDAVLRLLADSLLFGRITWDDGPEYDIGTESAAARALYASGYAAVENFDLHAADSLLSLAIEADPGFARAHLWLAQARNWAGDEAGRWLGSAERATAAAGAGQLTSRERSLASGLAALGSESFTTACATYEALRQRDVRDFAAWYGLGQCQTDDPTVVRDSRSDSGWRFRSSYHAGIAAYRRAFQLRPASFRLFERDGFERLRETLYTRSNKVRLGWGPSDARFAAFPEWRADTLLFFPRPAPYGTPLPAPPTGADEAALGQRLVFREIASRWVDENPQSAEAAYALGLALETVGDPAALEIIASARPRLRAGSNATHAAIREVWLRVKFANDDPAAVADARAIADSLLRSPAASDPTMTRQMAALAVLLGRSTAAALHARREPTAIVSVPPSMAMALTRPAAELLAFAAVGGPADSIRALEVMTENAVRNTVPSAGQVGARMTLLERPAFLAFPVVTFEMLRGGHPLQTSIAQAQAALARGDTSDARRIVRTLSPGGSLDILLPRAQLLAMSGDTAAAKRLLDEMLGSLRWVQPLGMEHPAHAGALIRAMALRAQLAAKDGDYRTARRWAAPVLALWSSGESGSFEIVAAMREIVEQSGN